MPYTNRLSANLKKIKDERNATYVEFAEELGIGKSTLQGLISRTETPRLDTIMLIAEKLNIPVPELLCGPEDIAHAIASEDRLRTHPLLLPLLESVLEQVFYLSEVLYKLDQQSWKDSDK